jgi:lipopolysaccharide transport system permease protein
VSQVVRIGAKQSFTDFLREVWEYRELFVTFAWRDLRVRYAQTFLGLLWAVVQPLLTILILWMVFDRFVKVDMGGVPPLAFIAAGVSTWTYFSFVLNQSSQSIIQSQQMIKKVYFPKIILPLSKALLGLIDLVIALVIMWLMCWYSGVLISSKIVLLPIAVLALILTSVGLGVWVSALTIRFRDVQQLVPFAVQIGLYITPVAYPASFAKQFLPEWAYLLYYANPMTGIIDLMRLSLFDYGAVSTAGFFSLGVGFVLFLTSVIYFKRTQTSVADLI